VVTGLKVYRNMVIQSLTIPRNPKTSNGLHFTAAFKEIRIVQNQFTRAPKTSVKGSNKKIHTGPATPKKEPQKKVEQSTLDNLFFPDAQSGVAGDSLELKRGGGFLGRFF
jgi:hypothetical protein